MTDSRTLRQQIVTRYAQVLVSGTSSPRVYDHCYRLVKAYAKAVNQSVQSAWDSLADDAEAFLS